jgi:hypothetical protein
VGTRWKTRWSLMPLGSPPPPADSSGGTTDSGTCGGRRGFSGTSGSSRGSCGGEPRGTRSSVGGDSRAVPGGGRVSGGTITKNQSATLAGSVAPPPQGAEHSQRPVPQAIGGVPLSLIRPAGSARWRTPHVAGGCRVGKG